MFAVKFVSFTYSSQAIDSGCDLVYIASSASILAHYIIIQVTIRWEVSVHYFTQGSIDHLRLLGFWLMPSLTLSHLTFTILRQSLAWKALLQTFRFLNWLASHNISHLIEAQAKSFRLLMQQQRAFAKTHEGETVTEGWSGGARNEKSKVFHILQPGSYDR